MSDQDLICAILDCDIVSELASALLTIRRQVSIIFALYASSREELSYSQATFNLTNHTVIFHRLSTYSKGLILEACAIKVKLILIKVQ